MLDVNKHVYLGVQAKLKSLKTLKSQNWIRNRTLKKVPRTENWIRNRSLKKYHYFESDGHKNDKQIEKYKTHSADMHEPWKIHTHYFN